MNSIAGTVAITVLMFAAQASAQWAKVPDSSVPLTPDGKPNLSATAPKTADGKPDLSGVWLPEPDPKGTGRRRKHFGVHTSALLRLHYGRPKIGRCAIPTLGGGFVQTASPKPGQRRSSSTLSADRRAGCRLKPPSLQNYPDTSIDRDSLRGEHGLSPDFSRRSSPGSRSRAEVDGLFDRQVGRRHPRRQYGRLQ